MTEFAPRRRCPRCGLEGGAGYCERCHTKPVHPASEPRPGNTRELAENASALEARRFTRWGRNVVIPADEYDHLCRVGATAITALEQLESKLGGYYAGVDITAALAEYRALKETA